MSTLKVNSIQHSNGTTALTIDSSGRVTKPNQPYFYVRSGRQGDGFTDSIYIFNTVIHNDGNCWVTSGTGANSRFVAPISGIYIFSASPAYKQTNFDWTTYFRVNGTQYAEPSRLVGTPPNSHSLANSTIILKLNGNDYVDLQSAGVQYHNNETFNHFTGTLLH